MKHTRHILSLCAGAFLVFLGSSMILEKFGIELPHTGFVFEIILGCGLVYLGFTLINQFLTSHH